MNNPLISVIVPVYKVENYLDKCIQSIVSQTYENLEIILVDDGSPDNCPSICDEWAKKDGRIRVIHKENGGLSDARNAGLNVFEGEFVSFVDSDDWIDKEYFELLFDNLKKNSSDVSICSFFYEREDKPAEAENVLTVSYEHSDVIYNYILDNLRPEACFKLYKRDVLEDIRFDTTIKYGEDLWFNYLVMKNAGSVSSFNVPLYHYLQRTEGSITSSYINPERARIYKIADRIINDCLEDENLYSAAIWRYTVLIMAVLSRTLRDSEVSKETYFELVEALLKYKKKIFENKLVSNKNKIIVLLLSLNKESLILIKKILRI